MYTQVLTEVSTYVSTYVSICINVVELTMSRHVGVGTLTGRPAGRARGYEKTGWCKGWLFESENHDPDPDP